MWVCLDKHTHLSPSMIPSTGVAPLDIDNAAPYIIAMIASYPSLHHMHTPMLPWETETPVKIQIARIAEQNNILESNQYVA